MTKKSEKTFPDKKKFLSELEIAIDGLTYMSETDAPFAVVDSELGLPEYIDSLQVGSDRPVEQRSAAGFLDKLTAIKEWFTPEQVKAASRFGEVRRLIEGDLTDLTLVRVGSVRIDMYLVGKDGTGGVAGIRTFGVET